MKGLGGSERRHGQLKQSSEVKRTVFVIKHILMLIRGRAKTSLENL
jgi:hypothetical protein